MANWRHTFNGYYKISNILGHFSQGEQEQATFTLDTSDDSLPSFCNEPADFAPFSNESADFAPFSNESAVCSPKSADCMRFPPSQPKQPSVSSAFSNEIYDDRVWCEFRKGEGFFPMMSGECDPYISSSTTV